MFLGVRGLGGKGEVRVGTTWQFIWQLEWTGRLGRKENTGGSLVGVRALESKMIACDDMAVAILSVW